MNRSETTESSVTSSKSSTDERPEQDRDDIERYLAQLDEEAVAGEIELQRTLELAQRLPWWMFGLRTMVP